MRDNKGKQFLGLLMCLLLGAGAGWAGMALGSFEDIRGVFAGIHLDPSSLLTLAVMLFLVLAVEKFAVLFLGFFKRPAHRSATVITILQSLLRYAAAIVILCWGLHILGVNVTTIVASVGIVALIIGFGAESLIEDVITGLFMLFENQYNVGDIVEVGGFRGTVTDIGIRTTCITDPGGNVKIINNSNMKDILNRSDNASRSVCDMSIPYETDLPAFEAKLPAILEGVYNAHRDTMKSAPVYLGVQELGDSAVVLRFVCEVDECNIYSVQRCLNRDLFVAFRKAGVEVPYPQLDLHQK